MSLLTVLWAVCLRELKRFARNPNEFAQPIVFFLLVITLLALAMGPNNAEVSRLAPTSAWVAVVLALTINLNSLFVYDFEDGSIEQLLLSPMPLSAMLGGKILAHWLAIALPQIVAAVVFSAVLGTTVPVLQALGFSLLFATPVLICIGGIAAALTVGLQANGILIALIAIPLYLPVLIFGTVAIANANLGLPIAAELYFLAGLSILALTLAPFAAAGALRVRLG